MAKTFSIEIDEHGNVAAEASGYKGVGCHAVQEVLSHALGGETIQRTRKPEYNQVASNTKCITR